MKDVSRRSDESGVALVTALLVLMLVSGLMAGMFAAITAEQRSGAIDRDQTQVYAAAHAGLEKLTADLASLFVTDFSPSVGQLNALSASARLPVIPGFEYTAPGGSVGSGYTVSWTADPGPGPNTGNPLPVANALISAGPYAGFTGILTPYDILVTARSRSGSEVRLRRGLQTVAVPVFQFGVFSDTDLTFYGGDDFDFGGRVHTNGNLYLSEGAGNVLLFTDKITAYGDVNRRFLSNGRISTPEMSGDVRILTAIGNTASWRVLDDNPNESSIAGAGGGFWTTATPPVWNVNGAVTNTAPAWATTSAAYNGSLTNRHTGATVLRLPLASQGAAPIDLIRRPLVNSNENTVNAPVYGQRYFALASLRILLSDRTTDITNLPTVTGTAPIWLDGDWLSALAPPVGRPAGYVVDATHPPIAKSIGAIVNTTNNNSTYAAPFAQIHLTAAVAAGFKAPALTMFVGAAAITNCTTRNITQFLGCTVGAPGIVAGASNLSATLPSGLVVSTATNGVAVAAGGGRTITLTAVPVTNPQPTARFVPGLIWVGGTAVTCEGYDATPRFTNCRGLTAAPGNNTPIATHALSTAGRGLIGGFIKIERSNGASPAVWTDVTMEILNLGIGAPNQAGTLCADPTPNAVLRIQRLRDNGNPASPTAGNFCSYAGSMNPNDWWPNALYDTREGNYRPGIAAASPMMLGGVMNYISLDVNNLRRWLAGAIPAVGSTGPQAINNNGYIVYFSDRRGDHTDVGLFPETGEYGSENFVNPTVANGLPTVDCPVVAPQAGEDVNGNNFLDCYGESPHLLAVFPEVNWAAYVAPFNDTGRPWHAITAANSPQGRVNRQVLFRRALKLVNGGGTNLPVTGLTVVAENPMYVQGNYNASADPVATPNETHAPAAVIADSVAFLSNNWTDAASFRFPNDALSRNAATTGYRFAVVTGKALSFPLAGIPGPPNFLFGTDGGAGNFLRMMEDWDGVNLNYRGSMVSLFISRQATGTFKWGNDGGAHNVYFYADRNFKFDDEFLQPALLPPGTPMFRDVNMLTFRQILRPNQ